MTTTETRRRRTHYGVPAALFTEAPVADLDALTAEVRAERTRPTWTTGADQPEGRYSECPTVVFDAEGNPAAFAVSAERAAELAEAMTVLLRLESGGSTEAETRLAAELAQARADLAAITRERDNARSDLAAAEWGADARAAAEHTATLRAERNIARAEAKQLHTVVAQREAKARRYRRETVDAYDKCSRIRQERDQANERADRAEAIHLNALHDQATAASVGRGRAAELVRSALAALEDDQ